MSALMSVGYDARAPRPVRDTINALYFVTATADPNVLPRVLEPFAKMGLTPRRLHASCEDGDGFQQSIDVRLFGVSQGEALLVEKMLSAVVGVQQVIAVLE